MKIAICDDEPEIAELIAGKIKTVYKNMDISIYTSCEELLGFGENIDILFLDIRMEGTDGMKTGDRCDFVRISGESRKERHYL